VDLDIKRDRVETVARRLRGSARPGGANLIAVQHWLLQFGEANSALQDRLIYWLVNDTPLWVAYQALMSGRLLGLNKFPGVRPVGVGEVQCHACAKTVLFAAREEAKESCGIDQLCANLEAGIEGGIHVINEL
jgi:hypothetical protein